MCHACMGKLVSTSYVAFLSGRKAGRRAKAPSALPESWIIKGFIPAGFFLLGLQGVAEAIRCVACLKGVLPRPVNRRGLIEGS